MFCKKEGKWTEVPYIQLFFFLRAHPEWLSKCRLDTQITVTLYEKLLNSLEEPESQNTILCPRALNNVKGGLPHDRNKILLLWRNNEC
jgi:hypothetical protein